MLKSLWSRIVSTHGVPSSLCCRRFAAAVGDEIKITSDDEKLKNDAVATGEQLQVSRFIKDMILQLLVKVKYSQGELIEARQCADGRGTDEGIDLPTEQIIHLKWDSPAF